LTNAHVADARPVLGVVHLFVLDLTPITPPLLPTHFYFCSVGEFSNNAFYGGQEYRAIPMEATGFERRTNGTAPQPTVAISNLYGAVDTILRDYGEPVGCDITRIRTLRRYLDDGESPDGEAMLSFDKFVIAQKVAHTAITAVFRLETRTDQEGTAIPRRLMLRDTCLHTYRRWTGSGFDYSRATCPYTGTDYFDVNDIPTTAENDQCSRALTGCSLRFPSQPLPTRAFPALGRQR
jgi:lambda family phage minor tail protein L